MIYLCRLCYVALLLSTAVLSACQTMEQQPAQPERIALDVPIAWGGDVRCTTGYGCRLVAVEHENNAVVLHQLEFNRTSRLLDKQPVAHHPDSAVWLADDLVAAAVEGTSSLDIYRVEDEKLRLLEQIKVGFSPRDVVLLDAAQGRYQLLTTPYSGKEIVFVDYAPDASTTHIARSEWCEAPWHPVRVERAPEAPKGGIIVACLREQQVLFAPHDAAKQKPQVLFKIPGKTWIVPRQARISPSGRWLYVALETGRRNVRIDMDSGAAEWIATPVPGAVSVLPVEDDLVIWGFGASLYIQRLGALGEILETRWLDTAGFPTHLQWQDVDGDGDPDLIVFNSSSLPKTNAGVEVIYGPVWEKAQLRAIQ